MPNRSTDALFQLIHTMEKSEKRNFKLYVTRNSSTEDLKKQEKLKETCDENNQVKLLMQAFFFEKNIERLHITRSMEDKADVLATEAEQSSRRLLRITLLSNLALKLYSWYIKHGHARN